MADGDPTLYNHGVFSLSGAALKTAVDAISSTNFHPLVSGASLHFVPLGNGQCQLLQVEVEGAG